MGTPIVKATQEAEAGESLGAQFQGCPGQLAGTLLTNGHVSEEC
jgi:hypothetical protein